MKNRTTDEEERLIAEAVKIANEILSEPLSARLKRLHDEITMLFMDVYNEYAERENTEALRTAVMESDDLDLKLFEVRKLLTRAEIERDRAEEDEKAFFEGIGVDYDRIKVNLNEEASLAVAVDDEECDDLDAALRAFED